MDARLTGPAPTGAASGSGAAGLDIRLLGALELRLDGAPLPPLESARARSLLARLLLDAGTPHPRQHLAFLLWPDSTEAQARTNLRHVLHDLRRALPERDRFLEATPRTLRWRADAPFRLDVAAFERAAAAGAAGTGDAALDALRTAADLYAGDLLEGAYDEWLDAPRDRLRRRYYEVLERLAAALEARGDHAAAIHYAERLLRHDPLDEGAYRRLMRLHAARGDRARALRVYHVCAATLERELGVEPSPATCAAYEALRPARPEGAPEAPRARRLAGPPLVGRAEPWSRLTALWSAAEAGRAHFVLISGEPGIGKTRLAEELLAWCAHRGAATATARSYRAEGVLAYAPVVAWLRSDALRPTLARLEPAHLTELARLLPELLVEVPGLASPRPLPPGEQRHRLFEALRRAFLPPGAPPLLLVADDVHWCDPESLQFLHYLVRAEPSPRLLVVATARREDIDGPHPLDEVVAGLLVLERFTEMGLGRLTRTETARLAEAVTGRALPEADAAELFRETEGNPLFAVEALRAGWTLADAASRRLPPKVQAVIDARLAQLSEPARELIGVAATLGREFTADLLVAASEADGETLVRGLDELWRSGMLREHGVDAYDFSHDRIREAAYRALGPARRRHHHLRAAEALKRRHAAEPGPVSGQIAAHYERAGAAEQAVGWYEAAADAALRLHANTEAVRLLSRAIELVGTLPRTPERDARELALLTSILAPLGAVEGYGSARLAELQRRGLELARALGVEPAPQLLRSLGIASLARGDLEAARRSGERLHECALRDADAVLRVEGDYVLGIAAFWQGEFRAAREHFEAALRHYRPEHSRLHLLRYGLDPRVICLSRLANTLWFLGDAAAAERARDAALAAADEVGHPDSRATAVVFAATLVLQSGDEARLREYAAALATAPADDFRPTRVNVEAFGGYVDVLDGHGEAGTARIRRALDDLCDADHAPGMQGVILRVLIEACAATGDARAGLAAAEQALARGHTASIWEADVRRLRARFLAALGAPPGDVEAELERALEVARRQGARMLELRAARSLVDYRLARGDAAAAAEARALVDSIAAALPRRPRRPAPRDAADPR
ncbi:MAG: AAA family ATPase [Gemmatimonadetes bacterium]|nr:AAA family ATPase [Gemmatimonadota bacterium]